MGGKKAAALSVGEVGLELGKKVAAAAVSVGVGAAFNGEGKITETVNAAGEAVKVVEKGGISKLLGGAMEKVGSTGSALIKGGLKAAESYVTSVATAYTNELVTKTFTGGDWSDWSNANESLYSVETIAGAISAGVAAGVGTAFSGMDKASAKFLSGTVKLVTAAGEAAKYGVYAGYSLAEGGTLADAYDNMGGITINVANLGSIIDMVGSGIARNNSTAQSTLGSIAQALSGVGLLEVNFGLDGVSTSIGMGGIDVGGAVYDLAKRGLDKAELERYNADDAVKGTIAMKNYVFGDWTAENTSMRLTDGLDTLSLVDEIKNAKEEYATALTTSSGKGRLIQMVDSGNVYNNAIQLQHESYRDGVKGGGQAGETVQAAKAHTEMAERMRSAGVGYANTVNLAQDLAAWDKAKASGSMAGFAAYALGNYDSSADFWRMTADGNVIFDKSKHLYDENGNLLKEYTGEGGYTASLADVMGISLKEAENMLGHLKWDGNTGTFRTESGQDIYNNKEYAINTPEAVKARYNIQMNYIDQVFESYGGNMLDTANAYINAKVYPPIYSLMDAMTNDEYLLLEFARDYNRILYGDENGQFIPGEGGLWDKTKFRAYTSEAGVNAVEEIKRSLTGGPYNDANPLYTHMGKEGVLYPLDTQATKTSTLSHYEDGRRHGWGSPAGLAIDISALNKDVMSIKGNFVFTQQYETLLGNSVSYNESKEQGYGQSLVTFTPDSTQIYGHFLIAENNNRSARVKMLVDQMTASNIWRVVIPPGTAVGDVGTTGHSTGIHAHIE